MAKWYTKDYIFWVTNDEGKKTQITTAKLMIESIFGSDFNPNNSYSGKWTQVGNVVRTGTGLNSKERKGKTFTLANGNTIKPWNDGYNDKPACFVSGNSYPVVTQMGPYFNTPGAPIQSLEDEISRFVCVTDGKTDYWGVASVGGYNERLGVKCGIVCGGKLGNSIEHWFKDSPPVPPPPPEPWGPESKPGGGGGSFDAGGDQISNPGTPQAGAGGSGFVTLYQPTVAQVKSLYDFLWSDLVSVDTFKKLFNDPMEALISFAAVPALSKGGVRKNIFFGNLDTGIASVEIGQYQHLDCGSIKLAEFFGSALDYAPYTQLTIFLPYVGYQELNVNDFMGQEIGVEYTVDMLSGACIAFVKAGTTIVSQFAGNCLSPVPITARDQNDIYKGALSAAAVVAGAVAMVATAGAAAPAAGAAVTSAGTPMAGAAAAGLGAKGVALAAGGALTAANIATTSRPHYQRSGSINGASGMLGIQTPYLIIERPDQSLAHDYNKFVGFPSNLTLKLGDLSGFTQVESIRLDGFAGASAAEISEIDSLLKSGVIL